ncbi:MAG: hypothetical protein U9R56_07645, partial [candidate division Zixibacteria bacterium]|nr:hypothetical protein [candidate division Zixibacteria bacterium]
MSIELIKTLCYFLTGGFLIFLAITLTRDNFASRLNRVTGTMLFFAGLGPIFMAAGATMASSAASGSGFETSIGFNLRSMWEFFFPMLLMFSWLFPYDRMQTLRHYRFRHLIFLPQVMHTIILLFFIEITGFLDIFQIETSDSGLANLILQPISKIFSSLTLLVSIVRTYEVTIFGAINVMYVITAVYFLESGKRLVTNPRILTQTRWILWGARIGLGLYIITQIGPMLSPDLFSEQTNSTILILALLTGSTGFIFATIRHQFLDVQMVFRQSFVNTVTSALLVAVYVLLVVQSTKILAAMFGSHAELIRYGFIILIL